MSKKIQVNRLEWIGRISLFVVFFWFGILKVIGVSPAHDLVVSLLEITMSFFPSEEFVIIFGIFEMIIGILFLIPKLSKVVLTILVLHMITTFLPLIMLPELSWQAAFAPTLVGQYILKNVVIVALAFLLTLHVHLKER